MQRFGLFLSMGILLLLSGCAFNSKVDCQNINWHRVGQKEGARGTKHINLSELFPMCGTNMWIDRAAYDNGWRKGVVQYCQPQNALSLGMAGKRYTNVCPHDVMTSFDQAWRRGLRSFCTSHNGYQLGLQGKDFPGFCPPDLKSEFHRAYERGLSRYQQVVGLKSQLDEVTTQLAVIQKSRIRQQQFLQTLKEAYANQPFSPQQQYRIQKLSLKLERVAKKETKLQKEKQYLSTQYKSRMKVFMSNEGK